MSTCRINWLQLNSVLTTPPDNFATTLRQLCKIQAFPSTLSSFWRPQRPRNRASAAPSPRPQKAGVRARPFPAAQPKTRPVAGTGRARECFDVLVFPTPAARRLAAAGPKQGPRPPRQSPALGFNAPCCDNCLVERQVGERAASQGEQMLRTDNDGFCHPRIFEIDHHWHCAAGIGAKSNAGGRALCYRGRGKPES